jgi:hypothetical protein
MRRKKSRKKIKKKIKKKIEKKLKKLKKIEKNNNFEIFLIKIFLMKF